MAFGRTKNGWGSFKMGKGTALRQDKRRKTGSARTSAQKAASARRRK